jgi:ferrochelatase
VSDHVEVRYDLDIEAAHTAVELGLPVARAATPGTDPAFVSMITELVQEHLASVPPAALGTRGPSLNTCGNGCCAARAVAPAGRTGAGR